MDAQSTSANPANPTTSKKRVYQMLGIDWESASPSKKTEIPA
jgi:hypothetical protein